jgi:hypothetical protein
LRRHGRQEDGEEGEEVEVRGKAKGAGVRWRGGARNDLAPKKKRVKKGIMFVSRELRKKNIAEYLLYMWQVEDLLRAYDCSLGRIRREYIDRFDYTDEQKEEMADWYGDLIRMMNQEGCRLSGHLQINKIVMQQLEELNAELLDGTDHPFYTSEYYKVLPYIVELRRKNRGKRSLTPSPPPQEEGGTS